MDRLLRPSAAAGLVIAIAFIALLVGFPSLAARMSANRVQAATAPSTGKTASMEPAGTASGSPLVMSATT